MRIAYARVSTDKQNLNRQIDSLTVYGYDKLVTEKFTGTTKEREGLKQVRELLRQGDSLIVESISRLGRNTLDILTTIDELDKEGVTFVSLKENIDTSSSTGKFTLTLLASIAQLERDLIVERVKEVQEAARKRGAHIGRPRVDDDKVKTALKMYDSREYSVKEITSQIGISQGKLYHEINKRKLKGDKDNE
ncbi:recombinase family protein [Bacillus cereus group sp. N21]|uniref:recombinase family protein n=1 Tax=Bacillus cereus group sp. N21 TaxID=2794591 RepID=UPI0018F28F2B|nr:recombinase family protein [Bacillus cereus group sp. N21]MBJ8027870.1 recombinase family protein [Bacillus cereus group sp. N21]